MTQRGREEGGNRGGRERAKFKNARIEIEKDKKKIVLKDRTDLRSSKSPDITLHGTGQKLEWQSEGGEREREGEGVRFITN